MQNDVPTTATWNSQTVCFSCQCQSKKIADLELKLADWLGMAEYQHFKDYDKNIFDVVFDIVKYAWGPR